MDCIFCKIVNNEIPSYTIYEDDSVKVFLDVNPVTMGHCLVVPKTHYKDINEMPNDLLLHIQNISKMIFKMYKEKLKIDGLTLTQNNEYGQQIKHYHMHLIPRYSGDNIDFTPQVSKNNIEETFKKISE